MRDYYTRIGGEPAVAQLVARFYSLMDTLPEAAAVRALHPADLARSREKLTLFLVGWMGGPMTYVERYGHPRLRARHLPFPIGDAERDQWMLCMRRALADCVPDAALRAELEADFQPVADFMRNREG